jgi:hypothetical protein
MLKARSHSVIWSAWIRDLCVPAVVSMLVLRWRQLGEAGAHPQRHDELEEKAPDRLFDPQHPA